MSNILHGAQSVIFLYLSCAPCYDAKRRWTQKRVSKGDRAAKAQFVEEQPGLYHHPSPMQTNPYWAEEIERGPNFEKGGKKVRRESRERELVSAGGSEVCATAMRGGRGEESIAPSSATVAGDSGSQLDTPDDATWNHKLYQREDEGLWGVDIKVTLKAGQRSVRHALNSAGTGMRTTLHDISSRLPTFAFPDNAASSSSSLEEPHPPAPRHPYFVGRNPPLNDLHPPIVCTTPHDKGAMKWMLQPPPPASIMAGKQRVSREGGRSRAESGASTLRAGSQVGLGRAVSKEVQGGTESGDGRLDSTELPATRGGASG